MSTRTPTGNGHQNAAVDTARREVARAESKFSSRLGEATAVGEASIERALSLAKPVLIGVAVVAGILWVASLFRRPRRRWSPSEPSVLKEAARGAALSLASTAARRVGERLIAGTATPQWTSPGRAAPPQSSLTAR